MNQNATILLTGAAGFIGSVMAGHLNLAGYENLVLVDDFGREDKRKNWEGKTYAHLVERYNLFDWLVLHHPKINLVIHLGARTDTTEFDYAIHQKLNVEFSQMIWDYCTLEQIPLIYASSAATYGGGEMGYKDDHEIVASLKPLNPYGISKNEFDKWALELSNLQNEPDIDGSPSAILLTPPFWAGLKFFNVYGPNEYHKGRMASVIWHAFNQIKEVGFVKLFRSHRPDFKDGEQLRDFIYVKDIVQVIEWMMDEQGKENSLLKSGLYNLGTGKARSFFDLATATFHGMDKTANIEFIDMPEDIRDKYQYFTEANMKKLRAAGYTKPFFSLEAGVDDYVRQYLVTHKYF